MRKNSSGLKLTKKNSLLPIQLGDSNLLGFKAEGKCYMEKDDGKG